MYPYMYLKTTLQKCNTIGFSGEIIFQGPQKILEDLHKGLMEDLNQDPPRFWSKIFKDKILHSWQILAKIFARSFKDFFKDHWPGMILNL